MNYAQACSELDRIGVRETIVDLVRSRQVTLYEVLGPWRHQRVRDVGVEVWKMLRDSGQSARWVAHVWSVSVSDVSEAITPRSQSKKKARTKTSKRSSSKKTTRRSKRRSS